MQLRSKLTVVRNIRIHHHSLLNAKRKMQNEVEILPDKTYRLFNFLNDQRDDR